MKCIVLNTNETRAVKIVKSFVDVESEIEMLRACRDHTNIVQLIEVIKDDRFTYIVTELLEGPELFEYVQKNRLSETEARNLFSEILKAVQFVHSKGIVHRDLKLENIMFAHENSTLLKLIDFGFAKSIRNRTTDTSRYSLEYAAPEMLLNKKCNEACDLWSLGVILYTLLCGHTPFQRRNEVYNEHTIRERVQRGSFDMKSPAWQSLNKSAKDLIRSLLTVCTSKRMKLSNIYDSGWFDAPIVNNHSSATEITQPPNDDQQHPYADDPMVTMLVTTSTAITTDTVHHDTDVDYVAREKSRSPSTLSMHSLSAESGGATSDLGLSKSSSGIGIPSERRELSIDSNASTIRNESIPILDESFDSKDGLIEPYENDNGLEAFMPIESTDDIPKTTAAVEMELEDDINAQIISDTDSDSFPGLCDDNSDFHGYECCAETILRTVMHSIDLDNYLLHPDEYIASPFPGRDFVEEVVTVKPKSRSNRRERDATLKRKYSSSSDDLWFALTESKMIKTEVKTEPENDGQVVELTSPYPKRQARSGRV